jgi:hypothetical protein
MQLLRLTPIQGSGYSMTLFVLSFESSWLCMWEKFLLLLLWFVGGVISWLSHYWLVYSCAPYNYSKKQAQGCSYSGCDYSHKSCLCILFGPAIRTSSFNFIRLLHYWLVYSCAPYNYSKSKRRPGCIHSGCDYSHNSCLCNLWPCQPYFILQFYLIVLLLFLSYCPLGRAGNSYLSAIPSVISVNLCRYRAGLSDPRRGESTGPVSTATDWWYGQPRHHL